MVVVSWKSAVSKEEMCFWIVWPTIESCQKSVNKWCQRPGTLWFHRNHRGSSQKVENPVKRDTSVTHMTTHDQKPMEDQSMIHDTSLQRCVWQQARCPAANVSKLPTALTYAPHQRSKPGMLHWPLTTWKMPVRQGGQYWNISLAE